VSTGTRGGRTRAATELGDLVRPAARAVARRAPELVAGLAVLVTVLAALAFAGAVVNDRTIAANSALAEAEVLEGSSFSRTLVRFTACRPDASGSAPAAAGAPSDCDGSGEAVVPERGVFYPGGLEPGETVTVEYAVGNPELVRVAGRTAVAGLVPLLLGVLAAWVALGPLAAWLYRRRRHRRRP
jgi:hypothetical protein